MHKKPIKPNIFTWYKRIGNLNTNDMKIQTPYDFNEIEDYIIGNYTESDWFHFTIYADKAPSEGDRILLNNKVYEVECVIDDTDDDDFEQGLSYSKVYLILADE